MLNSGLCNIRLCLKNYVTLRLIIVFFNFYKNSPFSIMEIESDRTDRQGLRQTDRQCTKSGSEPTHFWGSCILGLGSV